MHKSTGNWHSMLSSVARLRHVHCFSLLGQGNWLRPYSLIANKHMLPPPQKSCLTPAQDRCPAYLFCCDRRQALIPRDEFTLPLANGTAWYDTVGLHTFRATSVARNGPKTGPVLWGHGSPCNGSHPAPKRGTTDVRACGQILKSNATHTSITQNVQNMGRTPYASKCSTTRITM